MKTTKVVRTKPVPKSRKEIADAIKKLAEFKPKIRRYSFFGDDHWQTIDAQINVLKNDLDGDEVCERYGENCDLESAALVIVDWRNGEPSDYDPIDSWQDLVKV